MVARRTSKPECGAERLLFHQASLGVIWRYLMARQGGAPGGGGGGVGIVHLYRGACILLFRSTICEFSMQLRCKPEAARLSLVKSQSLMAMMQGAWTCWFTELEEAQGGLQLHGEHASSQHVPRTTLHALEATISERRQAMQHQQPGTLQFCGHTADVLSCLRGDWLQSQLHVHLINWSRNRSKSGLFVRSGCQYSPSASSTADDSDLRPGVQAFLQDVLTLANMSIWPIQALHPGGHCKLACGSHNKLLTAYIFIYECLAHGPSGDFSLQATIIWHAGDDLDTCQGTCGCLQDSPWIDF